MDIQKTKEFIVEQQAAHAAAMSEFRAEMSGFRESIRSLVATAEHMLDVRQQHETLRMAMAEAYLKLSETVRETAQRNREAHDELRDNLNILIRNVQDILPRVPRQ